MFCDRCGATVPADQRYCGRCGKDQVAAFPSAYPAPNRVQSHLRVLGILWLAVSALNAVGTLALLVVANTVFGHWRAFGPQVPPGPVFLHPLLTIIGGALLVKALLGFLAGYGLLNREPWARMLTIVMSILALFNIPFGTALGIYGLWVLLPAESEREYERAVRGLQVA